MGLRPQDPDTVAYETTSPKRTARRRRRSSFRGTSTTCSSIRSLDPVAAAAAPRDPADRPDRTLSEIWHFRLKGAPEAIYRRSLWYYNLVNSPATIVNADDLENWQKGHWGLASEGGDWVSFHRDYGRDKVDGDVLRRRTAAARRRCATSSAPG